LEAALAQPTWSFWVDVSGALYPGETHNVTVILRNTQCVERRDEIRFDYERWPTLMNLLDEDVERFRAKAEEGVSLGIFRSYSIFVNQTGWKWFGPMQILVSNITIVIRDYCVYKPIFVEKVRIWFPWKGYGRSLSSEVSVGKVLRGYEVSEFPLSVLKAIGPREEWPWYDYYRNVSVPFWVPEDLPSEFLGSQGIIVEVDARTEGGLWTFGGAFGQPSVRVTGQVDVRPFRTFTLRVTDGEGAIPLGGAEVNLKAHVYPFSLKLATNASGMVEVFRLPDYYTYSVRVLYGPPLLNESVPVLISDMDALQMVKGIRAELHTMRVFPKDLKGRPLEGAEVVVSAISIHLAPGAKVNPLSNGTAKGYAAFPLLPTGNYSYRVLWKGVEVCSGTRYLGYHPTYGARPGSFEVTCRVGDLRIRAVDGMNNAIGADFHTLPSYLKNASKPAKVSKLLGLSGSDSHGDNSHGAPMDILLSTTSYIRNTNVRSPTNAQATPRPSKLRFPFIHSSGLRINAEITAPPLSSTLKNVSKGLTMMPDSSASLAVTLYLIIAECPPSL
jgi:hypothetical protein